MDTTKAVTALGLSKLEFMFNHMQLEKNEIFLFSHCCSIYSLKWFFDSLFNEEKCLGWKGLLKFHQRLFLFNKSNLLIIWDLICKFWKQSQMRPVITWCFCWIFFVVGLLLLLFLTVLTRSDSYFLGKFWAPTK